MPKKLNGITNQGVFKGSEMEIWHTSLDIIQSRHAKCYNVLQIEKQQLMDHSSFESRRHLTQKPSGSNMVYTFAIFII